MRYLVRDDEGFPLRWFYTLAEAKAYQLEGWTIERLQDLQKQRIADVLAACELAPF